MSVNGVIDLGDRAVDATVDFAFTSFSAADVPTVLAGSPVLSVYKANSDTQSVAGITLGVDHDGLVGLNHVRLDLSADAFYADVNDYLVVITTGTIDSVSAVGTVVATFSIENRFVKVTRISAGGALNFEASEDNSSGTIDPGSTAFVGVETNNFTDTDRENGVYHVIADDTNVIDVVYGFQVGGGRTATELTFHGFANANNDDLTISVWDHPGAEWEMIGTLNGKNQTTNGTIIEPLLSKHTGTGTESGKTYIRFNGSGLTGAADLNTDQILIEAVSIGQSIGYANGRIWINTALSNTDTEVFVDGVADNPVSTIATAKTLSTSLGISDFHIINGSSIALAEDTVNESYFGDAWTLDLGGQDVGGAHFLGATVSGIGTGSSEIQFTHCEFGNITLAVTHCDDCDIEGIVTLSAAAIYAFVNCSHGGGVATIDFGSGVGNTTVHLHNYHGAITIKNMGQSASNDVLHFSSPDGKLTLDSTCVAGTVNLNGTFDLVNNGSGQTLNRDGDVMQTVSKFVFTNANEVDANTKSINEAAIHLVSGVRRRGMILR